MEMMFLLTGTGVGIGPIQSIPLMRLHLLEGSFSSCLRELILSIFLKDPILDVTFECIEDNL